MAPLCGHISPKVDKYSKVDLCLRIKSKIDFWSKGGVRRAVLVPVSRLQRGPGARSPGTCSARAPTTLFGIQGSASFQEIKLSGLSVVSKDKTFRA